MMTQDQYMALALQKYQQLAALQEQTNLHDHEKEFEIVWRDLGRQVLEKTISNPTNDRRKKKTVVTLFGAISIAQGHCYSKSYNSFSVSPLLQDKLLFLSQQLPYTNAHDTAVGLLGPTVSRSTLCRMTNHYGQALSAQSEQVADAPDAPAVSVVSAILAVAAISPVGSSEVVYALADGLMLLFEEGYKETKLGRTFSAKDLIDSHVQNRAGQISASNYVGHVGTWSEFWTKWQRDLKAHVDEGKELVFISDGVVWLHQQLQQSYPQCIQILDIYHLMEHLGSVAQLGITCPRVRQVWLDRQRNHLMDSKLDVVLANIYALDIEANVCRQVCNYLETNRNRVDYKAYLDRGLCIGSGAIESANKAVVQSRMKRSGQRWSKSGGQHVLDLRTCWMSGDWGRLLGLIEPQNYAMAA
ncbi:ISLre2 family transposase [Microcoleus sp. herbarium14]|uniref:ISLre2 family transposase n=1 Tax=Microcoleus sp. herbarium14 TaxID=3055439 RepID=UPI002FD25DFF